MGYEAFASVAESVLGQRSVLGIFGVGAVLLGALGWMMAARRRWSRLPAVLAGVSAALAVAVTQGRQPFQFGGLNFSGCVLTSSGSGFSELALNVALLMPLGLFASLATGRIVAPAVFTVVTSTVFEAAQGLFDTGSCVGQDALSNSIGGAVAAVLGGVVVKHWRRRRDELPAVQAISVGPTDEAPRP